MWGCKLLKNVPPSGAWSAPGSPPRAEVVSKGGKERLLFIFVLWHSHFSWDKRLSQSRKVHFVLLACTLFIFFKYLLSFRREAIYIPLFCSNNMRTILSRLFVLPYGSNGMGSKSKHVLAFLFFISLTFPILHARLYAWINVVYEESCETFASNNLPSKGMTITKAYLVLSTQQTCKHCLYFLLSHVFKTWHELQNSIPSLFQGATRKSLPNTFLWQPPRSMYTYDLAWGP